MCKIWFFNSDLQNFKYISGSTQHFNLKFQVLVWNSIHFQFFTHVMFQKWLKLHKIIKWSAPLLEFSTIFVIEKWSKNFQTVTNPNISYLNHHIQVLGAWIYFKCSLRLNFVKETSQFHWIWMEIAKVYSKVESEKVHNIQIMQELPTNKPNFPFKHTEDFNKTAHVASHWPIIFRNNISFYFNSFSFVQH